MALLTIINNSSSEGTPFNASGLVSGDGAQNIPGTLHTLGGGTVLQVRLDESKVSLFTNRTTGEPVGLAIDEDIPGVYRHPATGSAVSFLLVNHGSVTSTFTVVYETATQRYQWD